jgi:hypothetical protein
MKWKSFLKTVLGDVGFQAVNKADPVLLPVLVPRSILGWVYSVSEKGYDGEIPGINGSYISLHKNESGLEGAITIDNHLAVFENASYYHVAASIGSSLDVDLPEINPSLKKKDLTDFGSAIDLLIKTQTINLHKSATAGRPGPPAKPNEARPPAAPVSPSRQIAYNPEGTPVNIPNVTGGQGRSEEVAQKITQKNEESQKLKVTKDESEKTCQLCKKKRFKEKQFTGCDCLKEMSKHVKTTTNPDGFTLTFDRPLSQETLESLIDLLKD